MEQFSVGKSLLPLGLAVSYVTRTFKMLAKLL